MPRERKKPALERQAVKRKKRKKPSRLWKLIVLFGTSTLKLSFLLAGLTVLSLLFLCVYQYLLTSPYIRLEQVVIEGVETELKYELRAMSQLTTDTSLLAIRLNDLKKRLEKHPWIQTIHVERRFPHTLVIQAKKEKPRAMVVTDGLYYMNRLGKIFEKVDPTGDVDFPLITGISTTGEEMEKQVQLAAHILREIEGEEEAWSLEELSEIHLEKGGHASLYFRSLPAAIVLDGTQTHKKMDDLKRLVRHLEKTGQIRTVKRINLDYTDGGVVSLKL
ncbi:MAG: FtsQ-type POTRA domain-containing protein [Deltaproteobacteria bacterium]|nr:FtsQ-type POTRA domain-containing protein [Deltaproteobacteria bacterium]